MGPPERRGRDHWSKRPDEVGWSKSEPGRWRPSESRQGAWARGSGGDVPYWSNSGAAVT